MKTLKLEKSIKWKLFLEKIKKDGDIIAFLPEIPANSGFIMSYQHTGQHGEASLNYYQDGTKKANNEEYQALLNEIKNIYDNEIIEVKQKINYDDLSKSWV